MYHVILGVMRVISSESELGINLSLVQMEALAEAISTEVSRGPHCDHKFSYGGVKYEDGKHSLPGGRAKSRTYFDWFFCERCLKEKYNALGILNENTYCEVLFDATPKAER